jgi:hypothetical protein
MLSPCGPVQTRCSMWPRSTGLMCLTWVLLFASTSSSQLKFQGNSACIISNERARTRVRTLHVFEQKSLLIMFPSSHSSSTRLCPSPQNAFLQFTHCAASFAHCMYCAVHSTYIICVVQVHIVAIFKRGQVHNAITALMKLRTHARPCRSETRAHRAKGSR